jgi:hypothetical protein
VTFQTVLDTKRETPRAYKILTGNYLPKKLVTIEHLWDEDRKPHYGARHLVAVQHVRVTMPKWLAER